MRLAVRPQIKTVVTGDQVHARSNELDGYYADGVLGKITLDVAFVGVNEYDAALGAWHHEREATVNVLMASRAGRAVIAVDASKIDTRALAAIGGASLFSTIITDGAVTPSQRRLLADGGFEVIVAE